MSLQCYQMILARSIAWANTRGLPSAFGFYLPVIREYCLEEQLDFADHVQRTYLHELGHHISLDEKQVELRGV